MQHKDDEKAAGPGGRRSRLTLLINALRFSAAPEQDAGLRAALTLAAEYAELVEQAEASGKRPVVALGQLLYWAELAHRLLSPWLEDAESRARFFGEWHGLAGWRSVERTSRERSP